MKMFYTIPIFTMFINGFVADIGTVEMNTTDVIQNITSITNTTESPYVATASNVSTSTTYPTYTINKKNYTTSDTNDVNDKMYGSNFIIGSCMLYTLSQF